MRPVVIVGASLAGLRAAQAVRASGWHGRVVLVGAEPHKPYTRPPLSKELLDGRHGVETGVFPCDALDVEWRLGTPATALDVTSRTVTIGDDALAYETLIIATGTRARTWPGETGPDVYTLRDRDDALALKAALATARRVAIVGAGFIGCEVAASMRGMGVDVVLVEPQPAPLASVLGEQIGSLVARLHRAEGVDVRCGVGVAEVGGTERVEKVVLSDGTELDADLVVVGIGSRPATDWLDGSGIEIDNGIVCDTHGRASAPHVWAIGDVASWRHALGHQVRVEHWSNVADQARGMVAAILGKDLPATVTVPYFWSDQYDVKIQCLGEPEADDIVHVVEDDGRKFLAFYERDGVVAGVVGGGMPGKVMKVRSKIAAGAPIADVL